MEFQTLSHAGLRVAAGGAELVCDPWLIGSTYWRSWWNYPPVPQELVESLKPDFIYLTHLHWDHFQAASLRLFPDDVPMLVPRDRYGRMIRDLRSVGKTNVRELRHGERVELASGLAIRSFQFGPFVTDSAVVIEADDQVLLNANDAKFAGRPLDHILSLYPHVDFCFRSHSSANPRACFHRTDAPDENVDDTEHYLRSFSLFMERVQPRWAIPFASNNCLLHDDVFAMNAQTQTPITVRDYFARFAAGRGLDVQLQIMIPGDSWSSEEGFVIQHHDWFTERDRHLAEYRDRVQPTMEKQAALESRVAVTLGAMERFFTKLEADTPGVLLRPLRGREVLVIATGGRKGEQGFAVDMAAAAVREVPVDRDRFSMRIEIPALILKQSLAMNMFGHAGISKRVQFHASKADMPLLERFFAVLEWREAEIFPLTNHFTKRSIAAALPRWREGVLYARVLADRARGRPFPEIEERLLAG